MRVVLCDARRLNVIKDEADGFGRAAFPRATGLNGLLLRGLLDRGYPPAPHLFARLAAVFFRLGHDVCYVADQTPPEADLYVFRPALATLAWERRMIARILRRERQARVLVVGPVAWRLPEAFAGLGVTIVKGEAEQLLGKLDAVLANPRAAVHLGWIENLDELPPADWSPFRGTWMRPLQRVWLESSRGCPGHRGHSAGGTMDELMRFRRPEAVVEEIRRVYVRWGVRWFHFCDRAFGFDQARLFPLAERLARLREGNRYSVRTRPEWMPTAALRVLKRAGLSDITVEVDRPGDADNEEAQRDFFARCRSMDLRTTAELVVGQPDDAEESIRAVLEHALALRPNFARFHVLTPYPGSELFASLRVAAADFPFHRCDGRTALLPYQHLTAARVEALAAACYRGFYLRGEYLLGRVTVVWPGLASFLPTPNPTTPPQTDPSHATPPPPLAAADRPVRTRHLREDGPHIRGT